MVRVALSVGLGALLASSAAGAQPTAAAPDEVRGEDGLTDAERAAIADAEIIEVWDERPDKPFDRDTELRLTGAELAKRGATDLASALALLPDVMVRDAGRGGFNVDIRGARKGAVRVLVDGVSVTDPYYGTFDVSTIPVTDIEQIRVSTSPASPIDGPGGPGGVIEVHTRDAIGTRAVIARLTSDSLPTFGGSATGRTALAPNLSIRLSATALWGVRDFELPSMSEVGESRRATTGATRVEYRKGDRRFAVDAFIDDRHYVPPPNEESANANILVIDRETTGRVQAAFDETRGKTQLAGRLWTHAMTRRSRYFDDPGLTEVVTGEDLSAMRVGGSALVTRSFRRDWRWIGAVTIDHERADVDVVNMELPSTGDVTLVEAAAGVQVERGRFRGDASVGVAAPIGLEADPWPEGKLVGRWGRPADDVEVVVTGARKGRTPSLRERFDFQSGNPALGPEQAWHGELRLIGHRAGFQLEAAPYWRRSTGTMVADPMTRRLVNLGTVDVRGVDLAARARLVDALSIGGSYNLTRDRAQDQPGGDYRDDPIERMPDHRADAWLQGTLPYEITAIARGRYYGKSYDRGMTVASYTLVEASVSATIASDWLAVVRVDDLLDTRPETRNGFHLPGRVFSLIVQGTWD